ncbi:hypothetical protein ACWDN6_14605 [Streptomyces albogriseolus]
MSSTRRASKRARIARRAENDQMRTARRDSLAVLLSRLARGIAPTAAEVALLRAAVEAEIREGDAARTSERGQQRAMEQQRQRVDAAETAIVEAEQRAERAEHQVSLLHAVDEGRAHGAQRIMNERDQAQQRAKIAEAELRTLRTGIRAIGGDPTTIQNLWAQLRSRTRQWRDEKQRAAQAEELQRIAHETSNTAERARADAEQRAEALLQRAERAEQDRAALATALQTTRAEQQHVEAADTAALNLASSTIRQWKDRAQEAEERLARIRDMADNWKRRLPDVIRTATVADAVRLAAAGYDRPVMFAVTNEHTPAPAEAERDQAEQFVSQWKALAVRRRERAEEALAERDRYEAAWHSARQRAAEQRTIARVRQERLRIRARRITELAQRAEDAERTATAWEHAARRYAASMDAERDRADQAEAERDRAREQRNTWARQADAEILDHRQRAEQAEHRAGRYRLAWHAARRDRRADRAAMTAELPTVQAADRIRRYVEAAYSADISEGVRDDLRRLLDGQPPEYGPAGSAATVEEQPAPAECEVPWHVHVETSPGPECRSNTDTEA